MKCFGTNEYSEGSHICKNCRQYIECGEVNPKTFSKKNRRQKPEPIIWEGEDDNRNSKGYS